MPASANSVSADRPNAAAMALRTRSDGSCRPRSIWLRYGLDTALRAASSRSDICASWRCDRMNAPNICRWAAQASSSATPNSFSDKEGAGQRYPRREPLAGHTTTQHHLAQSSRRQAAFAVRAAVLGAAAAGW